MISIYIPETVQISFTSILGKDSLTSPHFPCFQASLGWMLYVLAVKSQRSKALPGDWGLAVVWSLSALALLPLLIGVIWYLTLASRGQIWVKVRAPV